MPTEREVKAAIKAAIKAVSNRLPGAGSIESSDDSLYASYYGRPWARVDMADVIRTALGAAERARK